MKIGNIELKSNIILAPMAGVTDLAYRIICKEMGAGLVVTEMVSAKGLYYEDKGTKRLTKIDQKERPVALQIFGSDPYVMSNVVKNNLNQREDIDIIDVNMGCPAPKIVKNGDGSSLLRDPKLVRNILREMVKVSNKPITLKIRIGWDQDSINGLEIGKIAEEEGVSALTVHGRTRDMFYSGKADWDIIRKIKNTLSIPVIGNGDVFQPEDGVALFKHTNCDGIAIGRGAMGNPWIFSRIENLMKGEKDILPTYQEIINMAIRHLHMACKIKGENVGVKEMRKHIAWYIKGLPKSNEIKNKINTVENAINMEDILLNYSKELTI